MPCDSTIRTRLHDLERVKKAAARAGLIATETSWGLQIGGLNLLKIPGREFLGARGDNSTLEQVTREYAASSVEEWADANGWTVQVDQETQELVLTQWGG